MSYQHDTYDRRIQLGASRRRREDAEALQEKGRWAGAVYLGGYAIECSLKSLICYNEGRDNFKDTSVFGRGITGVSMHDLSRLLGEVPALQRAIALDRTRKYQSAWRMIVDQWQKDNLRYWDKVGDHQSTQSFIEAVRLVHRLILGQQSEVS